MLKIVLHYGLHLLLCPLLGYILWEFKKQKGKEAFILILSTMLVDLDHLLANPIFDPKRLSVGFHFLHSYPMILIYFIGLFFPYKRFNLWWGFRPLSLGLLLHMLTDYLDFYIF